MIFSHVPDFFLINIEESYSYEKLFVKMKCICHWASVLMYHISRRRSLLLFDGTQYRPRATRLYISESPMMEQEPLVIPVQKELPLIQAKIKLSIYKSENDHLPPHPQKVIM